MTESPHPVSESRKQFEEWHFKNWPRADLTMTLCGFYYYSKSTQGRWQGWQASRALALEQAAKVCEDRAGSVSMFATSRDARDHNATVRGCATAIRSLLDKEANRG